MNSHGRICQCAECQAHPAPPKCAETIDLFTGEAGGSLTGTMFDPAARFGPIGADDPTSGPGSPRPAPPEVSDDS